MSFPLPRLAALLASLLTLAAPSRAHADEPEPAEARAAVSDAPAKGFSPDRTVAAVGAVLFGAGYAPAVATAAPSTLGLAGRIAWGVGTLGIGPLATCWADESKSYLCTGDHGSIQLLVPIAGPFLFAANHPRDTVVNPSGRALSAGARNALYASGAAQAVGAGLLVTSLFFGNEPTATPARLWRKRLTTGGGVLAAAAYGGAAAMAGLSFLGGNRYAKQGGVVLALPVAGPFLFAGNQPRDVTLSPHGALGRGAYALALADGAAQAVGLGAILVGLAIDEADDGRERRRTPDEARATKPARFGVSPLLAAGTVGLAASVDGF